MILADTSVWVDHLRRGDPVLTHLLEAGEILVHPFVIGELALGHLEPRGDILRNLSYLPQAVVAAHDEVLHFIAERRLFGLGIGYVDAHLLAAAQLTPDAGLWTHDRRLREVADRLFLTANLTGRPG